MPVVIHDFETLSAAETGGESAGGGGSASRSESAARIAAECALRKHARRQARLRG